MYSELLFELEGGRLSKVDLTSLDHLLLIPVTLLIYETSCLNEEANCTKPFPSVNVPCPPIYQQCSPWLW